MLRELGKNNTFTSFVYEHAQTCHITQITNMQVHLAQYHLEVGRKKEVKQPIVLPVDRCCKLTSKICEVCSLNKYLTYALNIIKRINLPVLH